MNGLPIDITEFDSDVLDKFTHKNIFYDNSLRMIITKKTNSDELKRSDPMLERRIRALHSQTREIITVIITRHAQNVYHLEIKSLIGGSIRFLSSPKEVTDYINKFLEDIL